MMGTKRLRCGTERRRGASRAVAFLAFLCAAALFGCGSGSDTSEESEKAADAEALNSLLSGELTLLRAYGPSLQVVRGADRALLLRLRGQDQAHVDALTKGLHGLGAETEGEAEALGAEPPPEGREQAIALVYEAEDAALDEALTAAPKLATYAPRAIATGLATNHAQHLVLLRQALGAPPAALVPAPFESGEEPPPVEGG